MFFVVGNEKISNFVKKLVENVCAVLVLDDKRTKNLLNQKPKTLWRKLFL